MIRKALAGVAAAAVLGTGAVAYAVSDPARPSLGAQVETEGQGDGEGNGEGQRPFGHRGPRRHAGHHLAGPAIHGDLVIPDGDGGWQEVAFDKGTVVSVDATQVVLRRDDDETVEIALTDATTYKGAGGWEEVETDERAIVISREGNALVVGQRADGGLRHSGPRSGMVTDSEEQVPAT